MLSWTQRKRSHPFNLLRNWKVQWGHLHQWCETVLNQAALAGWGVKTLECFCELTEPVCCCRTEIRLDLCGMWCVWWWGGVDENTHTHKHYAFGYLMWIIKVKWEWWQPLSHLRRPQTTKKQLLRSLSPFLSHTHTHKHACTRTNTHIYTHWSILCWYREIFSQHSHKNTQHLTLFNTDIDLSVTVSAFDWLWKFGAKILEQIQAFVYF